MRQRRIKNQEEKIEALSEYIVSDPKDKKGSWEAYSQGKELFLEIGCGKGQFITEMARKYPDRRFLAVEGAEGVVLRALQKAKEKDVKNVLFITEYIYELTDYFEAGEVAGIYLNFSDPWPKDRHAKRRLTHRNYLQSYRQILLPGSFIEFKTDNDDLFSFSLAEFAACGMEIVECTDDLHHSEYMQDNVLTEYEEKFSKLWKKINYCKVRV